MDEAKEKLSEFEQASQALLAELSALETEFEIEKTCRQQAEAYAAQVKRENTKLKRLSLALLPTVGQLPEEVANAANEEEPGPDPAQHCGQQLRGRKPSGTPLCEAPGEGCPGCSTLELTLRYGPGRGYLKDVMWKRDKKNAACERDELDITKDGCQLVEQILLTEKGGNSPRDRSMGDGSVASVVFGSQFKTPETSGEPGQRPVH
nr:PREDICTED: uncharacterized protein LOC104151135 [Struthio camelus australis]